MDKAKEFQEWVLKNKLSESTVKALQENGFDSTQSCELLNSAMIQKHCPKALTLGQTLLLQKAVDSLSTPPASVEYVPAASAKDSLTPQDNTTTPPAADATSNASMPTLDAALQNQGLDATSLLSILSANQPSGQTTCHDNGKGLTFDPFDCTGTSASCKSYDFRDFITTMPTEGREGGSIKVGDVELNLLESKPKLDSVTPLQYMEASLRILREMALKDGANLPQVLQYVGYLVKIANMGQRFQWKSVIKYDAEYRKAQAESGFPFGADSSFMMQLFLRDRPAAADLPNQTALLAHKHCLIPAVGSQYVATSTPLLAASFHIANLPMCAVHAMAPTASTATRIQPHLLRTPLSQKTPVRGTLPTFPPTPSETFTCLGGVPLEWLW